MRSKIKCVMLALAAAALPLSLTACVKEEEVPTNTGAVAICNGGFEIGNLSGWTVEYGDAFDDDSVSSQSYFTFEDDAEKNEISVDKTGSWYLSGKGYDGKRDFAATGAIRSDNFILGGNGKISLKLAGGALTENGNPKGNNVCFVGVYTAQDDKLIAKFTNDYFAKHTDFVDTEKYASGVFATDNFRKYTKDLSEYMGNEMYIRIVDNDKHWFYGYISVDDIRIGYDSAQLAGEEYTKLRAPVEDTREYTIYDVKNGGFETGDLSGWTVVSGDAFSDEGVTAAKYWWNEAIPYNKDGKYHYGYYKPSAVGVMRSSEFVVGGSGYVSFKLGGGRNRALTYLRFVVKNADGTTEEVARFGNEKYWDRQFPHVANGMKLINMVQYYADFSEHLGKTMFIEVVDNNSEPDDGRGAIVLDSVVTYYEQKPVWNDSVAYELKDVDGKDPETASEYQVKNGTFETGDLTGWTASDPQNPIGVVTDAAGWWNECFPYNKKGKWLFSGISHARNTGTLTSEPFTVGGDAFSFRMGGGGNPAKCYISVIGEDGKELARFANLGFADNGTGSLNVDSYLANMISYKGHWSALGIAQGTRVRLRITDNDDDTDGRWGLITADSFITYYDNVALVPKNAVEVTNILPPEKAFGEDDEYQILNGNFETGDLRGFTLVTSEGGAFSAGKALSTATEYWNEKLPYNKGGLFFFDGQKAMPDEPGTFALRSESFKLGGSGRISFKLGGRTAAVKVYEAGGELLAVYRNVKYNADDELFPHVDLGSRVLTMTTYVADLSEHAGKTLYIELCDEGAGPWGFAMFDDIVTYYETAPDLESSYDAVKLNHMTSAEGDYNYRLPWEPAVKE